MPSNTAAWLVAEKQRPLEEQSAEYVGAAQGEVVIKTGAVALNPVDWARQDMGSQLFSWTTYPTIIGTDLAGEVVDAGPGSSDFKPGDRVLGMCVGLLSNRPAEGAFQAYAVLPSTVVSKIPPALSYEQAAAIPLGLSTAACGLFQKHFLALDLPSAPARPSNGKTILIWGGSTSVGTNAIQLAVVAGYEVVTTASAKNHEYLRKLGAAQAFDYKSDSAADDIVTAFQGKDSAGALAIGLDVSEKVAEIVKKIGGVQFIACSNPPAAEDLGGVACKFIFGSDLKDNEVGPAIFRDFLPQALANGTFVSSPPVEIAGKGFGAIQGGLDLLKQGVSLKKLVVSI